MLSSNTPVSSQVPSIPSSPQHSPRTNPKTAVTSATHSGSGESITPNTGDTVLKYVSTVLLVFHSSSKKLDPNPIFIFVLEIDSQKLCNHHRPNNVYYMPSIKLPHHVSPHQVEQITSNRKQPNSGNGGIGSTGSTQWRASLMPRRVEAQPRDSFFKRRCSRLRCITQNFPDRWKWCLSI